MVIALVNLLLGALLGLWFEVLVLVPAVLLAAVIVGIDGWAHSLGLSKIIVTLVVSAIALETGYLGGAAASALIKMQQFRASRFLSRTGNAIGAATPWSRQSPPGRAGL
jgi:hypothetical protein